MSTSELVFQECIIGDIIGSSGVRNRPEDGITRVGEGVMLTELPLGDGEVLIGLRGGGVHFSALLCQISAYSWPSNSPFSVTSLLPQVSNKLPTIAYMLCCYNLSEPPKAQLHCTHVYAGQA